MDKKHLFIILLLTISTCLLGSEVTKYVRYTYQGQESYGILEGDTIRELDGDIFSTPTPSGKSVKLSKVRLLAPCKPSKVIAVGLNYRSHIGNKPVPEYPGLFAKYPSSIIGHEEHIVMPSDATNLHFEGEMVIVIGKKAKNISVSDAHKYIFGITAGNDVSERKWQRADLQWLKAKASDTFGPIGPAIVTGLNYNDLLLQTRLNGEVQQSERTKDLVFNVETIVSYISQYVTLLPGDLIFTGTPGKTKAMKPNDIVEIELEGVGVLRNTVIVGKVVGKAADAAPSAQPTQGDLLVFLGAPQFALQQLYGMDKEKERGGRNIVAAQDGTVLAFDGPRVRRSTDGGKTWGEPIEIGPKANGCNAVVDEVTGAILLVDPDGHRLISHDAGQTWKHEAITVRPNLIGHGSSEKKNLSVGSMQPGITLTFGKQKGRLLMPARWTPSNSLPWRPYIYNTAIYSDDRGKTWQTTMPFPVLGTGEAALAEISDGRILYSSREHMSRGNRFFAWSYDSGDRWLNFWRSEILPDGARGTSYGCMGGLIRLPVTSQDILVYSNLDTEKGVMPPIEKAGASRGQGREKITVWASFDGGETWPVKRLVFDGPSAYSNLAVGRPDTPSQGLIYLLFEGGKEGMYSGIQVALFNLAWLLDGEKTGNGRLPEWVESRQ